MTWPGQLGAAVGAMLGGVTMLIRVQELPWLMGFIFGGLIGGGLGLMVGMLCGLLIGMAVVATVAAQRVAFWPAPVLRLCIVGGSVVTSVLGFLAIILIPLPEAFSSIRTTYVYLAGFGMILALSVAAWVVGRSAPHVSRAMATIKAVILVLVLVVIAVDALRGPLADLPMGFQFTYAAIVAIATGWVSTFVADRLIAEVGEGRNSDLNALTAPPDPL
jgi:hypothetical protein